MGSKWRDIRDSGGTKDCAFNCTSEANVNGQHNGIVIARALSRFVTERPATAVVEIQHDGQLFFAIERPGDNAYVVSLMIHTDDVACGTHTILTFLAKCEDVGFQTDLRYETPVAVETASRMITNILSVPYGGGALWE
jgi:hypothetical protein